MRRILTIILIFSICIYISQCKKQCYNTNNIQSNKDNNIPINTLKLSTSEIIKDLQTGLFSIVNSNIFNKPQRYTFFNITLLLIVPKNDYEIVASLQQIQNYQDKDGMDFSLKFNKLGTVVRGMFVMSKTAIWTQVNIRYIVTQKQDFRVGVFVPDVGLFISCVKPLAKAVNSSSSSSVPPCPQILLTHRLTRSWSSSKKQIFVIPFLNGIKTLDSQANIMFNRSSFNIVQNLIQIPISMQLLQNPLQYISISYMVVTMDSDFQINNIYDLSVIPNNVNVFIGMTGVSAGLLNKGMNANIKSNSTNNPTLPGKILSNSSPIINNNNKFYQFFKVKGMVIQSNSGLDLLFSSNLFDNNNNNINNTLFSQQIKCFSPTKCVAYDGYMKYSLNQNDFVFVAECVPCQGNATYSNLTEKCQCRNGYVRSNDSKFCLDQKDLLITNTKCKGQNEVYNKSVKKCQCVVGFVIKDDKCVKSVTTCPSGFFLFKGVCYRINWNGNMNSSNNIIPKNDQRTVSSIGGAANLNNNVESFIRLNSSSSSSTNQSIRTQKPIQSNAKDIQQASSVTNIVKAGQIPILSPITSLVSRPPSKSSDQISSLLNSLNNLNNSNNNKITNNIISTNNNNSNSNNGNSNSNVIINKFPISMANSLPTQTQSSVPMVNSVPTQTKFLVPMVDSVSTQTQSSISMSIPFPTQTQSSKSIQLPICSIPIMLFNPLTKKCECPINFNQDKITKKCVFSSLQQRQINCLNLKNQQYNKILNKCVCSVNTFRIQGKCQSCQEFAYFNGEKCMCKIGYKEDGKVCVVNKPVGKKPLGSSKGQNLQPDQVSQLSQSIKLSQQNKPNQLLQVQPLSQIMNTAPIIRRFLPASDVMITPETQLILPIKQQNIQKPFFSSTILKSNKKLQTLSKQQQPIILGKIQLDWNK